MTDLRRGTGTTLWQQIGEVIAGDIAQGRHGPGEQLPAEPEFMERFGVSRSTVRRALAELEARGLVRVEQGRGTFVHDRQRLDYSLSERTRFSQNVADTGREPAARTLREEMVAASPYLAEQLRVPPGEMLHHLVRIGLVDDIPANIGDVYYPARRFPDLPKRRRTRSDVTSVYAEYGVNDYVRLQTSLTTRLPTPEEARALNQPRSQPVMVVTKIDADLNGVPIAYAETAWAGQRVRFTIDNTAKLFPA